MKANYELFKNRAFDLGRWFTPVVVAALFLVLGACSSYFGDHSKKPQLELNDPAVMCLKTVGAKVQSWIETGAPAIETSVDCVIHGLDKFADRVKGDADDWTVHDIDAFLNTHFKTGDSKTTVAMALKLKQAWLGGKEDRLTRPELDRVRALLRKLKPELSPLSGKMSLISLRSTSGSRADAETAAFALTRIFSIVAGEVVNSNASRSTLSFEEMISGLEQIGFDGSHLKTWLPLFQSAKSILVGGSEGSVTGEQWPRVFRAAGSIWGLALRIRYGWRSSGDLFGTDLNVFDDTIRDALKELLASIRAQERVKGKEQMIATGQIATLLQKLGEKELLPSGLTSMTLQELLPAVLGKILYGNSYADRDLKSIGFGIDQYSKLVFAYQDWFDGQKSLLAASRMQQAGVAKALRLIGSESLLSLFNNGRWIVRDDQSRLIIDRRGKLPEPTRADLDLTNATRTISAILIRGYSHSGSQGLTRDEMQEIYVDARNLGSDLGFIDVRNMAAGTRTYMEASLFTSSANGENLIPLPKVVEWFMMAYSGNRAAGLIQSDLLDSCRSQEIDIYGQSKLEISCFRKAFSQDAGKYLANLPGLVAWLGTDPARVNGSLRALEEAGRAVGAAELPLEPADLKSLMPILIYTENLFISRDTNGNDILDDDEIRSFYPVVKPFLADLLQGKADSDFLQEAVFTYMIHFGEIPPNGVTGALQLGWWGLKQKHMKLSATRLDILKIMAGFANFSRQKRTAEISSFLKKNQSQLKTILADGDLASAAKMADLFQCQPQVAKDFSSLMKLHINELVPKPSSVDVAEFIRLTKIFLSQDARLTTSCLPF